MKNASRIVEKLPDGHHRIDKLTNLIHKITGRRRPAIEMFLRSRYVCDAHFLYQSKDD